MTIFASDPINGGVIRDTFRRDTISPGDGPDLIILGNDAKADSVLGLADGVDKIDIQAWDATWEELSIKQVSLRKYVVWYRNEEKLTIRFERPDPDNKPEDGYMLTPDDFVFRDGLPQAQVQVRFESSTTSTENLKGTTLPDEFIFQNDGFRDTIRRFEPGKDVIDLADYNVNFFDLEIIERKPGRILIDIPPETVDDVNDRSGSDGLANTQVEATDRLVLLDISKAMVAEDVSADWFIF
ncbi:MAG: hypothetical protein AAGA19_09410 [Pseudomonadota bacterium]